MTTERGSALVVALLVAFIVSLLGASFLLMAQTESRIAGNERQSAQALYLAEAGARVVKGWFDRPGAALSFPSIGEVDRSLRRILDESDPYERLEDPPWDEYKETDDAIFERPYRGADEDAFMGTEEWPDIRIDDGGGAAQELFLAQLSQLLAGSLGEGASGVAGRISRIDVYAPPYVEVGSRWTRFGMATVKVTARIYRTVQNLELEWVQEVVAERTVKIALNELPYSTPVFGPLHTCGNLTATGQIEVHWGAVTAMGDIELSIESADIPRSVPRTSPPGARIDRLWTGDPLDLDNYAALDCAGAEIEDPWFRMVSRGAMTGPPSPEGVFPPDPLTTWRAWPSGPPYPPDQPDDDDPWPPECSDHSGLVQQHPIVSCPAYDYDYWKTVAQQGGPNVGYFVYDGEGGFRENGGGEPQSFAAWTNGRCGLFFFDTEDGREPYDDDLDGIYDNLTPEVIVSGNWSASGLVFLNAENLKSEDVSMGSIPIQLRPPGELFVVEDEVETWINLEYPESLEVPFRVNVADTLQDNGTFSGPAVRNTRGRPIETTTSFQGIIYNNGRFESSGTGRYYGSVIARGGMDLEPSTEFYWDALIGLEWPPPAACLPRVAISRWIDQP